MILPTKTMEESMRGFKWLFSEEKLSNTPSIRQGISPEKELTFRQKEAILIQAIGSKAQLTQLAVKTSVIIMHRFFMYRSVTYYPRVQMAIAFALAGGKVEESENARKLEHLMRSAVEVLCTNKNREFLDKSDPFTYEMDCQLKPKIAALKESKCSIDSVEYMEMRKLILECETEIYSVIGFQLHVVHPHNFVLRICHLLGVENIKDITQYAYNLATASSQLTMLCLKYKPETIATMCLNVAFKANGVKLKSMKDSKINWYQVYDPSTDFAEIEAVSEEFLHLLKSCPLLHTWMVLLSRIGKRGMPSRVPGGYVPSSRQHQQLMSSGKVAPGAGSSNNHSSSSQGQGSSRYSRSDHPRSSQGEARLSEGPHASFRPQSGRSSLQLHPEGSSHPHQPVGSSRSSQENPKQSSRLGSSSDIASGARDPSRDSQGRPRSMEVQRQREHASRQQQQQQHHAPRMLEPVPPQSAVEEEAASSPQSQPSTVYSPAPVRPPSPPFPPPADMDLDEEVTASGDSVPMKVSPPDLSDNNSLSFPSSQGSKLSLSDYRQRASAKVREKANSFVPQGGDASLDSMPLSKLSESPDIEAKSDPPATSSLPDERTYSSAVVGPDLSSFTKPQVSPSNPRIKIKVKRDPTSGEQHSVKYADSGLKIKIKPPKPESSSEGWARPDGDASSGPKTPREEGEILESSPSPTSSTGSGQRSEGIRIRLSVPKGSSSDGGGGRRDSDRESGHRSHHHGHHHHRSHHKSKKHKEHRSGRHESHTSHKRQGSSSSSYEERQAKSSRMVENNTHSSSYPSGSAGAGGSSILPPPLPSQRSLQHQDSGFSINEALGSGLPPSLGSFDSVDEPSTPDIPAHHQVFHRMLEQHRISEKSKRPPLPPVPPPPPPPPPPPSM